MTDMQITEKMAQLENKIAELENTNAHQEKMLAMMAQELLKVVEMIAEIKGADIYQNTEKQEA